MTEVLGTSFHPSGAKLALQKESASLSKRNKMTQAEFEMQCFCRRQTFRLLSEALRGSIRKKTALLAKRTLKLIEAKQRPKQLMKPESQLMMYLLNKQGHPIQAESINTPNMENTEAISKKKNDLFVLGLWDSPYMSGKSQPELLTRSVLVHVNCTADTGDPLSCN